MVRISLTEFECKSLHWLILLPVVVVVRNPGVGGTAANQERVPLGEGVGVLQLV